MTSSVIGIDIRRGERIEIPKHNRLLSLHCIGNPGTGKSTLFENLIRQDAQQETGMLVIDPHGSLIAGALAQLPQKSLQNVIFLNFPEEKTHFGLNLLECPDPTNDLWVQYTLSLVRHVFEKAYGISPLTPRLYDYLTNCAYTLIINQLTLLDIFPLLANESFRANCLKKVHKEEVLLFWRYYGSLSPMKQYEEQREMLNKFNDFSYPPLKAIIGEKHTTLNLRHIMDERKIVLLKLDARLDTATSLIGTMMIALTLTAAYSRENIDESKRKQFHIYVDEFQRFATDDFALLITEGRKWGVGCNVAHQNFAQLDRKNKAAVKGCGTKIIFRVSGEDAQELKYEFEVEPQTKKRYEPIYTRNVREKIVEYWENEYFRERHKELEKEVKEKEEECAALRSIARCIPFTDEFDYLEEETRYPPEKPRLLKQLTSPIFSVDDRIDILKRFIQRVKTEGKRKDIQTILKGIPYYPVFFETFGQTFEREKYRVDIPPHIGRTLTPLQKKHIKFYQFPWKEDTWKQCVFTWDNGSTSVTNYVLRSQTLAHIPEEWSDYIQPYCHKNSYLEDILREISIRWNPVAYRIYPKIFVAYIDFKMEDVEETIAWAGYNSTREQAHQRAEEYDRNDLPGLLQVILNVLIPEEEQPLSKYSSPKTDAAVAKAKEQKAVYEQTVKHEDDWFFGCYKIYYVPEMIELVEWSIEQLEYISPFLKKAVDEKIELEFLMRGNKNVFYIKKTIQEDIPAGDAKATFTRATKTSWETTSYSYSEENSRYRHEGDRTSHSETKREEPLYKEVEEEESFSNARERIANELASLPNRYVKVSFIQTNAIIKIIPAVRLADKYVIARIKNIQAQNLADGYIRPNIVDTTIFPGRKYIEAENTQPKTSQPEQKEPPKRPRRIE